MERCSEPPTSNRSMENPFEAKEEEGDPLSFPTTPIRFPFEGLPQFLFEGSPSKQTDSTSIRFPCEFGSCTLSFSRKDTMKKHRRRAHGEKYNCRFADCKEVFDSSREQKSHARAVHHNKTPVCDFENCKKRFGTRNVMLQHRRNVHFKKSGGQMLLCEVEGCGKYFATARYLSQHKSRMHIDAKSPVCHFEGCDVLVPDKRAMRSHVQNVHSKMCVYEDCGAKLASEHECIQHVKASHPVLTDSHCQYCGKRLSSRAYKEKHVRKAHGESSGVNLLQLC